MSLLVLVSFAAASVSATPAGETAQEPVKVEKKVCRVDTTDTGSRVKKRVCMTKVEWENRDAGKSAGDLKTMGAR